MISGAHVVYVFHLTNLSVRLLRRILFPAVIRSMLRFFKAITTLVFRAMLLDMSIVVDNLAIFDPQIAQ
jgi:hypothetical protein